MTIYEMVFSTYVEVILIPVDGCAYSNSILHVCGGDPRLSALEDREKKYSPRMWR